MNNKYDVSLTDNEKQQLVDNIKEIVDYLKGLVKPFISSVRLNAEWSYYDRVWGKHTCRIEVEKTFRFKGVYGDSEKEWFERVSGQIGRLSLNFEQDIEFEKIGNSSHREYALSLLDNWKQIKQDINVQIEQRENTRQLLVKFEL